MKVIIIGAGLGGLACAIACTQEGLDVILLERAPEILPVGAGIQVHSNASIVARRLRFLPALLERAMEPERIEMRRYDSGKILYERLGREFVRNKYGAPWFVIHRADYHEVMMETAKKSGVDIRLGCFVESIDFDKTQVLVAGGGVMSADVIIGADGLWSTTRESLLGYPSPPTETGDLAYRATIPREHLMALHDPRTDALCIREVVTVWVGPEKHCVFYPIHGGKEFNMVLLRPDDMSSGERSVQGDVDEMRQSFAGWDEVLTMVLSKIESVVKWKLCHHEELATWTKGAVALLGDACHPTLPYQGQGAAMAVEDGATLGKLLGSLKSEKSLPDNQTKYIPEILRLYEARRKSRTTLNVQGAIENKLWYHLEDGPMQKKRDLALSGGPDETGWCYIHPDYRADLLGFDAVADSEDAYRSWLAQKGATPISKSGHRL
ncbi:hypothetical protein BKA56DRAFT_630160 [Ilyonectria sp. MPI-CAGE-AT-0026]|nr:hypothetical protein BKA56DRAFT_630160 [Ilyonectria sp. MPI-CAGE-AT-0026]